MRIVLGTLGVSRSDRVYTTLENREVLNSSAGSQRHKLFRVYRAHVADRNV
jgi:hypothetical protein